MVLNAAKTLSFRPSIKSSNASDAVSEHCNNTAAIAEYCNELDYCTQGKTLNIVLIVLSLHYNTYCCVYLQLSSFLSTNGKV